MGLGFATSLFSQEKTSVSIKVEKDGKVMHDTTYSYDDAKSAKHLVKMAEAMSKGDLYKHHSEHAYVTTDVYVDDEHGQKVKAYVYVDKDGHKTEVKEIHEDSLVTIVKKFEDGEEIKVIKKQLKVSAEDGEMKKVYVVTSEGDEATHHTIDILKDSDNIKVMKIKEGEGNLITIIESEDGAEKEVMVKVISDEDGEGTWTVESDGDEEVIILKREMKEKMVKDGENPPPKKEKKTKKQK